MNLQEIIVPGIISLIVAIISSLVTFWVVNVFYAKKQARRRDKMFYFGTLMATRDMMEREWVRALNLITIVFADNTDVLNAWRSYHTSLKVEKTDEWTDAKRAASRKLQIKLLEAMSNDKDLGYKNITWDIIDDSYYPEWLKMQDEGLQN
ncbi:MAG: hypothetical protein FWC71_01420 [Defluviitaleaceae bacterium]|nr:hypothetical protein [Defluviitaleaceae bacterium]